MQTVLAIVLLAGACSGHYGLSPYKLPLNHPMPQKLVEPKLVECPVCRLENSIECEPFDSVEGRRMLKKCRHGTFLNTMCNNKTDCYRGPEESCNEDEGIHCVPSLSCNNFVCSGTSDTGAATKLHSLDTFLYPITWRSGFD